MARANCNHCGIKIGYLDVIKAPLPWLVKCGNCKQRLSFNYNPWILFPILLTVIFACLVATSFIGQEFHSMDLRPRKAWIYLTVACMAAMLLVVEVLYAMWLLNTKKTH